MFNYIEKEDGRFNAGFHSQPVPTGSRTSSSKSPHANKPPDRATWQKDVCAKPCRITETW
jgi:hypothetical protein